MTSLAMADPEWVMFGMSHQDGVRLIASNSLTMAELETEYSRIQDFGGRFEDYPEEHTLSVTMGQYVIVDAPDWPTAFAKLFRMWSPDGGKPVPFAELPPSNGSSVAMVGPVLSIEELR